MPGAGVTSYRGFLYQQEFFYKFLLKNINNGDFNIGFEVSDDVNIEYKLASISYKKILIQVKTGDLDDDDFYKIFDNWLIETAFDSYKEYRYQLISEKKVSFDVDSNFFTALKKHIGEAKDADIRTIKRKAYNKIKDLDSSFVDNILNHIIDNYDVIDNYSIETIKREQYEIFDSRFCVDINKDLIVPRKERFDFVKQKITNEMVASIESRWGYSISNVDFTKYLILACQKYGNEIFDPDFIEFRNKNKVERQIESILSEDKLEVKQLRLAERSDEQIYEDVLRELFYRRLIDFYKEKDINKVLSTHEEAKNNYRDALDKLDFYGKEKSPKNIYFTTTQTPIKSKIISQAGESVFLQKGCYIYMTSQEVDDNTRIKWGDIDDKN